MNEVHISSLIVHVVPEHLSNVVAKIKQLSEAEIHATSPEGKIIVVIETKNQGYLTDKIEMINQFDHVLNVALVYHQIDQDDE